MTRRSELHCTSPEQPTRDRKGPDILSVSVYKLHLYRKIDVVWDVTPCIVVDVYPFYCHLRQTTLQQSVSRLSRQCAILNISQLYKPPRPVTGIAFTFIAAVSLTHLPWNPYAKHSKSRGIYSRRLALTRASGYVTLLLTLISSFRGSPLPAAEPLISRSAYSSVKLNPARFYKTWRNIYPNTWGYFPEDNKVKLSLRLTN
jgi:hypothetical protein